MLYLNVSDQLMEQWGRTIDLYYSIHLGNLAAEIKSVNLLIEEESLSHSDKVLYLVEVTVISNAGGMLRLSIERENCGDAIEQCFAKAKRYIIRRIRGLSGHTLEREGNLGDLRNRA